MTLIAWDGVHLASPDVNELHRFAESVGLKRCWFEGARKAHPHYDCKNPQIMSKILASPEVQVVNTRELIRMCYGRSKQTRPE